MDGILFRLAENRFWFVQPDGDFHTWFLAHKGALDVTISDPASRVLQVQGPGSFGVMQAASNGAIDRKMGYYHAGFFDLGGQKVFVSRTGWTGEMGFEVYTLGDDTDCPRLWDHLMAAGAAFGIEFGSMQSMNIRRIEAGILDCGGDFDSSMTPFEAGLDKFVHLDKADFIGRAALTSAKRGKRIYGMICEDLIPACGARVLENGKEVGIITTGAYSPYLETGIGYVRFHESGDWSGKTLALENS
jgi:glycine cleavage system aminomethyltransferase T